MGYGSPMAVPASPNTVVDTYRSTTAAKAQSHASAHSTGRRRVASAAAPSVKQATATIARPAPPTANSRHPFPPSASERSAGRRVGRSPLYSPYTAAAPATIPAAVPAAVPTRVTAFGTPADYYSRDVTLFAKLARKGPNSRG
eukprot:gene12031-biopygen11568